MFTAPTGTFFVEATFASRIEIADRQLIVERGRIAWSGSSAELDADRSLWSRYLGA